MKYRNGGYEMLYAFDDYTPEIGEGTYISETATVIGNVKIGKRCYIGHDLAEKYLKIGMKKITE
jgi:acetyltransferase-like isoleucine patch superfamily enzyme